MSLVSIPLVNANQNETYMLHGVYIDLYIYMMEQNMHMYTNFLHLIHTCWEMVQGIKSPDALFPLDKLLIIEALEISPSKHTYKNRKSY